MAAAAASAAIPSFTTLFRLDHKTALITGGSRGLGFYIAAAFLQAGCRKVILVARNEVDLASAADQLNAIPGIAGRATYIAGNVGRPEGLEALVGKLRAELPDGKLDILVNNAGASWPGAFETFEDWKVAKTLDVNVRAVFNLTARLTPFLTAAGTHEDPARILIVSSVGGTTVPHVGPTGAIAYSISKAAAHHLGRNLAVELGGQHVTTNIVAPGWFPTRLANPAIDVVGGEAAAGKTNPMGRLGRPEDMAGVAVFLCSRAGAYVNGEDIAVDGGKRLELGGVKGPRKGDSKL
jgi:NAD(P)-dependent dehydrogenase (short-subunit alcohol dehydrogenase family)